VSDSGFDRFGHFAGLTYLGRRKCNTM
jgi:hypothetical protein